MANPMAGKAALTRFQQSSLLRAYTRYTAQRGSRLAAAMTYSAFLSLFPLLALAVAIVAAAMGDSGVATLRRRITDSVPGLADKLPLDGIVANAATIGAISGALLVWSGLSWVNMARGGLRTIWRVDDMPGGFAARKAADLVALAGFGVTAIVSVGASAVSTDLAGQLLRGLGLEATAPARFLLGLFGILLGLAASTLMFGYLLAGIPRLRMPRRILIQAALFAAVLFEAAKGLLAAYFGAVAGKSLYGAFGAPIAVLLWFNLTFQVILLLSAWTATRTEEELAVC